jgi:hypothetical protein
MRGFRLLGCVAFLVLLPPVFLLPLILAARKLTHSPQATAALPEQSSDKGNAA